MNKAFYYSTFFVIFTIFIFGIFHLANACPTISVGTCNGVDEYGSGICEFENVDCTCDYGPDPACLATIYTCQSHYASCWAQCNAQGVNPDCDSMCQCPTIDDCPEVEVGYHCPPAGCRSGCSCGCASSPPPPPPPPTCDCTGCNSEHQCVDYECTCPGRHRCSGDSDCINVCSVTATAVPNPIPQGQNQTTISATSLSHTSLSKCKVDTYTLPHTFTQTDSSHTYTVSCTGDAGYNDCSNDITVTIGSTSLKYSCNISNWQCSQDINGSYTSMSACQTNCHSGTKYSCNTSTGQCYADNSGRYTALSTCQANCSVTPPPCPFGEKKPHNICDVSGQCVSDNSCGVDACDTAHTCSHPQCQILDFKINDKDNTIQDPLIVWVNTSLTGYFSVNDSCKTCTVSSDDTWGSPPQSYPISTLKSSYTESFKISTASTYSYTLECVGTDPEDIVTDTLSLQTVKAVNLPWWREIIPNLLPFLRGMIR